MHLRGFIPIFAGVVALGLAAARGQQTAPSPSTSAFTASDWLKAPTTVPVTVSATSTQDLQDPFAVVSTGSLWQEKYGLAFVRPINDLASVSYETNATAIESTTDDANLDEGAPSTAQKAALQFQPAAGYAFSGDLHEQNWDAASPTAAHDSSGVGLSAQTPLPLKSKLILGLNCDSSENETLNSVSTADNSYQAEYDQPVGKLPVTAVVKGRYEETESEGSSLTRTPSLEQSLVWKPTGDMTLAAGLRQQQYENIPGLSDQMNEALFADWSLNILPDIVTWHSYAEMLNARNTTTLSPTIGGVPGTSQATTPGSNPSLSSAVPLSATDQRMTFSTGPSFKLQKDISASIEYSSRWDQNPAPGALGQEQRVSVSLKGTF